jgi:porphyrinogen peroxidase
MQNAQPGILAPVPKAGRHLLFSSAPGGNPADALKQLADEVDGNHTVVGLGQSLVLAAGGNVAGLRAFPVHTARGIDVPSTPFALWAWLKGDDRGELVHRTRMIQRAMAPSLSLDRVIDTFMYGESRDLSGYEDGTENPEGDDATEAAILQNENPGLGGSSFVAVQQWIHSLDTFEAMSQIERDHTFGRRRSDNEEIDDAPESAHVKRTAQETFSPEAFVLRRSMPWSNEKEEGLVFVAFGKSFDAFEAQLNRMVGAEDGITDALFRWTRPVTGSYFWCPPIKDGHLDLSALGL